MKIQLQNIALSFDEKALFSGLDLTVETGDFVLIQGASGIGKTSLLRLFNRLQDPTSGQILVDDQPADELDVPVLRRRIGYVQQTPILVDGTVRDNLLLPFTFKAAGNAQSPDDSSLENWLADFQLDGVALDDDAQNLSVGQKQRIAFIRSLLVGPDILLGDEPTSALDEASRVIVEGWLERIALEKQAAVVMITHTDFRPKKVVARRYRLQADGLIEIA
jgi:putative ABC transport system ATP-binding protein